MNLKVVKATDDDGYWRLKISLGTLTLDFKDGESEDNSLGRNFNDCFAIKALIKEANELGLRGEAIEMEEIQEEDRWAESFN